MNKQRALILYIGTPEFAVSPLEALVRTGLYEVAAVITQPDKPAGRGQKLSAPAVKKFAISEGIRVFQPKSLKGLSIAEGKPNENPRVSSDREQDAELPAFLNTLERVQAIVTCAYGKIIPPALLDFSLLGVINIHPSLLPRWRGAAPIQHAIFSGDKETGVSLMKAEEGLDTGPVFFEQAFDIGKDEYFNSLHDRLAKLSSELIVEKLPRILSGELTAKPQADEQATYAEKWDKEDLTIDWTEDSETITRRVRASSPYAGCRTSFRGEPVKIYGAHSALELGSSNTAPGKVIFVSGTELIVSAGSRTAISLDELQTPGKKRLPVKEILKGRNFAVGDVFSAPDTKNS